MRKRAPLRSLVQIVDPADELGRLYRCDVEIDHEAPLPAAGQNAMELELVARVDFLVRHVRGNVDE